MHLVPRPLRVRGLMNEPAFTQRILDRILGWDIYDEHGRSILELRTNGTFPLPVLQAIIVVWIAPDKSLAARVELAQSSDGKCRLALRPWMRFVNHDTDQPELGQGIHLWLGAAWRHLQFPRAA